MDNDSITMVVRWSHLEGVTGIPAISKITYSPYKYLGMMQSSDFIFINEL
ncbi:MAG: hypothetical protein LVQ63_07175 [Thermoplasmatales archaeon]|nr:hypothetical protein [Thermoplasmatales archaeon]